MIFHLSEQTFICEWLIAIMRGLEQRDVINALRFYSMAEYLFYYRLIDGDFYQKRSLERVIKVEEKIRKEIKEEVIPDLSCAGYGE